MHTTKSTLARFVIGLLLVSSWLGLAVRGNPPANAQATPVQKIESDDGRVVREGTWLSQSAPSASGGSYVYNVGAGLRPPQNAGVAQTRPYETPTLSLHFSGPSLEIIYISGPSLGTLAIEVDGTVLRTVIITAESTAYGQSAKIDYLTDEVHELKIYAQGGGVVAIDAFVVSMPLPALAVSTVEAVVATNSPRLPCHPTGFLSSPFPEAVTSISLSGDGHYVTYVQESGTAPNRTSFVYFYDLQTCVATLIASEPLTYRIPATSMSANAQYVVTRHYHTVIIMHHGFPFTVVIPQAYLLNRTTGVSTYIAELSGSLGGSVGEFSTDGAWWVFSGYDGRLRLRNMATGVVSAIQPAYVVQSKMAISDDGQTAVFATASQAAPTDSNTYLDVYSYDQTTQGYTQVSVGVGGAIPNGDSDSPDLSSDGRFVIFDSLATNLVSGDVGLMRNVYLVDRNTNQTSLLSGGHDGTPSNGNSYGASLSANGRYAIFLSSASNLVPNDTNGVQDAFLYDRLFNRLTRISAFESGPQATQHLLQAAISADGTTIAFLSDPSSDPGEQLYLAAVPSSTDRLALFRPDLNAVGLLNNLHNLPSLSSYQITTMTPPAYGQWVMGDWDGDGDKTPGVYGNNGVFYYANATTATATWSAIWIGLLGRPPVVGRFNSATSHDCIGAVDSTNFPPYGTAFALYFTCDLTPDTAPTLTFQWLSVILPDAAGFSGTHQFSAGDFDNNGVDSVAIRRGAFIAFGNVPPTTLLSDFSLAQYWGEPPSITGDEGVFLTGDFDDAAGDSFGVFYQNGHFYYRNAMEWSPVGYELQRVGQPMGTPVQATSWR